MLDCDHGLGFVTKTNEPSKLLPYTKDQIEAFTYEDFDKNRNEFINLKSPNYFYDYFKIKQ